MYCTSIMCTTPFFQSCISCSLLCCSIHRSSLAAQLQFIIRIVYLIRLYSIIIILHIDIFKTCSECQLAQYWQQPRSQADPSPIERQVAFFNFVLLKKNRPGTEAILAVDHCTALRSRAGQRLWVRGDHCHWLINVFNIIFTTSFPQNQEHASSAHFTRTADCMLL